MNNKDKSKHYTGKATKGLKVASVSALVMLSVDAFSAQNWPGEDWDDALKLGSLEESFSDGDISGAHWNNNTKTLWLSDNKEEMIWSLKEKNETFYIDKTFEAKGDLEGITQALDDSTLYLRSPVIIKPPPISKSIQNFLFVAE